MGIVVAAHSHFWAYIICKCQPRAKEMSTEKPEERKEKVEASKPPEAPAKEAVIGETPQQDRWKQMEKAHYLEQDESATGLFYKPGEASKSTGKFGIDGLEEAPRRNANGTSYQVHRATASQAMQGLDPLSKPMTESAFQSSVKMQIQATQVPEVSPAVDPKEALKYAGKVMESGVAVVRQAESHMTQANAINNDLINAAIHYSQSPYQLNQDLLTAGTAAIERLDKPMTVEQRAGIAGALMPMFFFDGHTKPVETEVAQQMKLEEMSADQLKALGIERVEMHMPSVPEHLQHLEYQKATPELIQAVESKGRTVSIGAPGSPLWDHLEAVGAEAKVTYPGCMDIVMRQGAKKAALLEEFLHGTQAKIGIFDSPEIPYQFAEIHVKDFMVRHSRLLGLNENDLVLLKELKRLEIEKLNRQGFRWIDR